MQNDFDVWNTLKKSIDNSNAKLHLRIRSIYWISIGENIGYEQNGKNKRFERPVLVLKVFNKNMFLGIPLTSGNKNKDSKYYFPINYGGKKYFAILPQVRLFSSKRVLRFVRKISVEDFKNIKENLKALLNL